MKRNIYYCYHLHSCCWVHILGKFLSHDIIWPITYCAMAGPNTPPNLVNSKDCFCSVVKCLVTASIPAQVSWIHLSLVSVGKWQGAVSGSVIITLASCSISTSNKLKTMTSSLSCHKFWVKFNKRAGGFYRGVKQNGLYPDKTQPTSLLNNFKNTPGKVCLNGVDNNDA